MMSYVSSVWSATWSVHGQTRDQHMISHGTVHDRLRVGAAFRPHEANLGLRIPDVGGSSVSHPVWWLHFSHLWRAMGSACQQYSFLSAHQLVGPGPMFSRIEVLTDPVPRPHSYTAHTSLQNQAMWWTLVWTSYCYYCYIPQEPGTRNKPGEACM